MEHFLGNAAQRRACPWARPDACAIYPQRFLGCRAYGLWSPEAYAVRAAQALQGQQAVAQAWQGLGVTLPPRCWPRPRLIAGRCDRPVAPAWTIRPLSRWRNGPWS